MAWKMITLTRMTVRSAAHGRKGIGVEGCVVLVATAGSGSVETVVGIWGVISTTYVATTVVSLHTAFFRIVTTSVARKDLVVTKNADVWVGVEDRCRVGFQNKKEKRK